ncbi:hypothetical protein SYNTR_0700 [Candidatus Syntrophocurvum alkaliphilum]|uniref:Uncharacterized protein n=1 Tax=Candidatus Syntrophocurvum alkaliphilum TaxID=2293317 RepID=A0A6I6DFY7_9FIRM|nr:hypothetical protein [Candidatus Syntrophocurvum alkaliphilum]QGT99293.1 hypothetical protein SYNTR_0700 [Candidatus Syntrophocurvum alkaliphilum]
MAKVTYKVTYFEVFPEYKIKDGIIKAVGDVPVYTHQCPSRCYLMFSYIKDEESLVRFANKYGLPGASENAKIYYDASAFYCMHDEVKAILDEALNIRNTLNIIKRKKRNVNKKLTTSELLKERYYCNAAEYEENYSSSIDISHHLDSLPREFRDKFDEFTTEDKVNNRIAITINDYISNVGHQAYYNPINKDFESQVAYDGLISACWYQMYLNNIVSNNKLKTCPECGDLHEGQGKFCPPEKFGKSAGERSNCQNKYTKREWKRRKEKSINKP